MMFQHPMPGWTEQDYINWFLGFIGVVVGSFVVTFLYLLVREAFKGESSWSLARDPNIRELLDELRGRKN